MEDRLGKGAIALFLCLGFLSVPIFIFTVNGTFSKALADVNEPRYPDGLVEAVDAEAFIGPMAGYEYDLYRSGPNGPEYIPSPELDYKDIAEVNQETLKELSAATEDIDVASREVTLHVFICPPDEGGDPCAAALQPTPFPISLTTGQPFPVVFALEPATKTVVIEEPGVGLTTQVISILPTTVDLYVAARDPVGNIRFLNRFSVAKGKLYNHPVLFWDGQDIGLLCGPLFGAKLNSSLLPGFWTIFAVMVPPGTPLSTHHTDRWISNLGKAVFFFKG
ncbi:MAG: hypothetical protein NTZ78_07680 [Candidatus Aureabacteria bacterium]|nr:hypothetical protein [Candidatus Auribacterota bacterium]